MKMDLYVFITNMHEEEKNKRSRKSKNNFKLSYSLTNGL